jgi:hypothetical protein
MTSVSMRAITSAATVQMAAPDPMLEQYARQLRRELELVERKLRGETMESGPPEAHMG